MCIIMLLKDLDIGDSINLSLNQMASRLHKRSAVERGTSFSVRLKVGSTSHDIFCLLLCFIVFCCCRVDGVIIVIIGRASASSSVFVAVAGQVVPVASYNST